LKFHESGPHTDYGLYAPCALCGVDCESLQTGFGNAYVGWGWY